MQAAPRRSSFCLLRPPGHPDDWARAPGCLRVLLLLYSFSIFIRPDLVIDMEWRFPPAQPHLLKLPGWERELLFLPHQASLQVTEQKAALLFSHSDELKHSVIRARSRRELED